MGVSAFHPPFDFEITRASVNPPQVDDPSWRVLYLCWMKWNFEEPCMHITRLLSPALLDSPYLKTVDFMASIFGSVVPISPFTLRALERSVEVSNPSVEELLERLSFATLFTRGFPADEPFHDGMVATFIKTFFRVCQRFMCLNSVSDGVRQDVVKLVFRNVR